jgi:uncharacterized protein YwlG (UPF0340 family)
MYLYRNGCSGFFFVIGLETLQIQGVEMSAGGSTESNVSLFEALNDCKQETSTTGTGIKKTICI